MGSTRFGRTVRQYMSVPGEEKPLIRMLKAILKQFGAVYTYVVYICCLCLFPHIRYIHFLFPPLPL